MTRLTITAAAAAAFALCCGSPAISQAPPGNTVLVRAGNLFDSETGVMAGPRDILIRGDRIIEVSANIAAPEGAAVLDLRNCSVLPGLIDAHTHVLLEQRFGESLSDAGARDQGITGDAYRVLSAVPRTASYLEAGFTTIRDLGNSGRNLDLILRRAIDDGRIKGPRLYASGAGLAPAGGQMEPAPVDPHHLVDGEYRILRGPEDARQAVREAVAAGASVIKMYPEATPQRTRLSPEEMLAIVAEARRHGLPVAAHATSDASIREAVEAGVSSIEHGYEASDETLRLMARKGVWLVPTDPSTEMALEFTRNWRVQPSRDDVEQRLQAGRERLMRAHRFGVPIALGSDLYAPYAPGRGAASRETLFGYVEAGLTPGQALQAATWQAGRLLGDDALGVVRAGAWADMVAAPADPTIDIGTLRDTRLVMKAGQVVHAAGSCSAP